VARERGLAALMNLHSLGAVLSLRAGHGEWYHEHEQVLLKLSGLKPTQNPAANRRRLAERLAGRRKKRK